MENTLDVSNNEHIKCKSDEDILQIILRQTTYTSAEAKIKLIKHNNNYIAVINEYMKPNNTVYKKSNVACNKSMNQQIYTEIRKFLDNANLASS